MRQRGLGRGKARLLLMKECKKKKTPQKEEWLEGSVKPLAEEGLHMCATCSSRNTEPRFLSFPRYIHTACDTERHKRLKLGRAEPACFSCENAPQSETQALLNSARKRQGWPSQAKPSPRFPLHDLFDQTPGDSIKPQKCRFCRRVRQAGRRRGRGGGTPPRTPITGRATYVPPDHVKSKI